MGLDNPLHIAFIVVILLLVFGAKRLPELGRSLGSGMREFKDSVTGNSSSDQAALPAPQQAPVQTTPVAQPAAPQAAPAAPAQEPPVQAAPAQPAQPQAVPAPAAPVEPQQQS
jgi:sec-independent protein translocase protein TatA